MCMQVESSTAMSVIAINQYRANIRYAWLRVGPYVCVYPPPQLKVGMRANFIHTISLQWVVVRAV